MVQVSTVDAVVLLLCISGGVGSTAARRCKQLLLSLLDTGAFPFSTVVGVLSGDRQQEVTFAILFWYIL